jgi:hypothetical protein
VVVLVVIEDQLLRGKMEQVVVVRADLHIT